jgi:hypothetical protein
MAERARLHERVKFEMRDELLKVATVCDALVGGDVWEMRDELELSMFLLDRETLDNEPYDAALDDELIIDEDLSYGLGR